MMERPCADSEEKREPVSDTDTAVVDSLKVQVPSEELEELARDVGYIESPPLTPDHRG